MARHTHNRRTEKLQLVYNQKRDDLRDVYSDMFSDTSTEENLQNGNPTDVTAQTDAGSSISLPTKVAIPAAHSKFTGETAISDRGFTPKSVQAAHTLGEQNLYYALWTSGKEETASTRISPGGYRTLAVRTRSTDKAVKRNLRSLEQKLAIECIQEENVRASRSRIYRVFSYEQILERRRTAGLNWVVRNGPGVTLTSLPMDVTTTAPGDVTTIAPGDIRTTVPGDTTATAPGDVRTTLPGDVTATQLEKGLEINESTSSLVAIVAQIMQEELQGWRR